MGANLSDEWFAGFFITFSPEILHNTRSIYSAFDFLGDIGGLFDMLRLLAEILL